MKLAYLVPFVCLFVFPFSTFAASTLTVDGGATTQPSHWTVDQLRHQPDAPTTQVSYERRGTPHHATCIALIDLLHAAGIDTEVKMDPKADPHTKHAELRMFVTARGGDGYAVVFSFAELLPEIGKRDVWIALDEDDKPLEERDNPVKLIVPGDAKPARWVHGVQDISVDSAKPAQ